MGFIGIPLLVGVAAYLEGWWVPNLPRDSDYPVRGIDVSRHQGTIDWNAVAGAPVRFVYIKATEGMDLRDERFAENWRESAAAGMRRGAYHFFTLKSSGRDQAANFIAAAPNDPEALPPVVDVELWGNSETRPAVSEFQRQLSDFLAAVRTHYGREPVIYTANDFREYYLRDFPIERLWIRAVVTSPRLPEGLSWQFWQYSEKGRIPGINGFVDRNVFHGDELALDTFVRAKAR